jgi:hypothetical protein
MQPSGFPKFSASAISLLSILSSCITPWTTLFDILLWDSVSHKDYTLANRISNIDKRWNDDPRSNDEDPARDYDSSTADTMLRATSCIDYR